MATFSDKQEKLCTRKVNVGPVLSILVKKVLKCLSVTDAI